MQTTKVAVKENGWLWGRHSAEGLLVALATVAVDQAHKYWMLNIYDIESKGRVEITPFFDLVFVKNTGISYSMFHQDTFAGQVVLAAIAAVACLALWIWLARSAKDRVMTWSLALIIGGAIANAVDRLLLGGVADFFSLHAFGFYWYVFNIADMAIVAGVVGLMYDSWVRES